MNGHILLSLACSMLAYGGFAGGLEHGFVRVWSGTQKERRIVKAERQGDGALRYRVKTCDMPRNCTAIDIVPDAAVAAKCDGYWVAGDQRWGRLDRDSGTFEGSRQFMPVFGLKTPNRCWVGIVKGLRLEYKLRVVVDKGVYNVYPRFKIDKIEFDPYEDIVVDYYELKGDDANYSGMAKTYRKWNLGRGWVKPLRERVKGNEALAWSAKSIFMRCKLSHCVAHCHDNPAYAMPPVVVRRTFDDYMNLLRQVKAAGMDYVDMCIVGWNHLGFDGPFPKLFPVYEPLGGEAKMREAIALAKSLGYRISVHVNNHNIYRACGERWNLDDVCKDVKGRAREYGFLQGGLAWHTCFQVVNNRWIDEDLAKLKGLGLNGIHHVDVTSATYPKPCHDPMHPNNRKQMAEWQIATARKAQAVFGGYSSESSMDHIAPALDNALYVSTYPVYSVRKTELVDGEIPLWQIAYNGIIMHQPFWSTVDASYPHSSKEMPEEEITGPNQYLFTPENRILKLVEYSGRPMFYFQNYNTIEPMKQVYDLWQPLKHLQFEFIDSHEKLADGVYRTRWENGDEIVVNYSPDKAFSYRGRNVAPKGYEFYKSRK